MKWTEDRARRRKDIEMFVRRYLLKLVLVSLDKMENFKENTR